MLAPSQDWAEPLISRFPAECECGVPIIAMTFIYPDSAKLIYDCKSCGNLELVMMEEDSME